MVSNCPEPCEHCSWAQDQQCHVGTEPWLDKHPSCTSNWTLEELLCVPLDHSLAQPANFVLWLSEIAPGRVSRG